MFQRSSFLLAILLLIVSLGVAVAVPGQVTEAVSPPLICLDPGHGGNTGAYNATYDLWEDAINLDVAMRLKALLEVNQAHQVVLTRTDSTSNPSNRDRYTLCNSVSADILVSIHTNSATNQDIDGTMTLYKKRSDEALAVVMHQALYNALNNVGWSFTDYGLDIFASGVLLKSDMPAVMIEPVLMSHPDEAGLLAVYSPGDDRRQTIANAAYAGIVNYLASQGDNSGGGGGSGQGKCPPKKPGCS